jgi:hypothetical protein
MSARAANLAGVTLDVFRAVSIRIVNDGTPSAGHDLVGIEIHFDALLGALDEVDDQSVRVHRTEHAERLIHATCRTAPGVPLGRAAEAVRVLWLSNLRFSYFEAHHVQVADDEATLDFITQIGPHRLYVTGQVRISPR